MDLGWRFSSRLRKSPNRFKSDKSVDGTYDWTIDPKRILPNLFLVVRIRSAPDQSSAVSTVPVNNRQIGDIWTGLKSHGLMAVDKQIKLQLAYKARTYINQNYVQQLTIMVFKSSQRYVIY